MATYNNGNATAVGNFVRRTFGDIVPGSGSTPPPTTGQLWPRGNQT